MNGRGRRLMQGSRGGHDGTGGMKWRPLTLLPQGPKGPPREERERAAGRAADGSGGAGVDALFPARKQQELPHRLEQIALYVVVGPALRRRSPFAFGAPSPPVTRASSTCKTPTAAPASTNLSPPTPILFAPPRYRRQARPTPPPPSHRRRALIVDCLDALRFFFVITKARPRYQNGDCKEE